MRNNANPKDTQYNPRYSITPAITTIAIPLLIGRIEKTGTIEQPSQEKAKKSKPKATKVQKYEISNYILKFLAEKGFFKKRWIVIKEIPINEITLIKNLGNELSLTWKGVTESFVSKNKELSFKGLPEQIQSLLDGQQKNLETAAKANQRKRKLAELIDASVCIVDLSFDMLMALQVKPVNWANLEIYTKSLTEKMSFAQQTLTPLNLDFSKITGAIKSQTPEEASKETFNVLNLIYGYFDKLKIEEDLEAVHPNIKDAKAAILACYTLNDLFLGKIVGEKDNQEESQVLETALQNLTKDTNFKLNYQDLKANFDKTDPDSENEGIIESSREIFKEQLRNIDHSVKELLSAQTITEQTITIPESQPFPTQETQISPKALAPEQPQSIEPIVEPPETMQPIIEPTPIAQTDPVLLPNPPEPIQPTEPQDLRVEPSPSALVVEKKETMKPKTGEPEVQLQESVQTEVVIPIDEEMKNPSELPPKKKSAVRRLRKAIMGY